MVSCQNGPTRHAYAWQIGPFWQDSLDLWENWLRYNGPALYMWDYVGISNSPHNSQPFCITSYQRVEGSYNVGPGQPRQGVPSIVNIATYMTCDLFMHYNDVIMGMIASQITSLTIVQTQIKENIKALCQWPLCGEFTGDRWIPHTNDQLRRKCFHLMMSSWKLNQRSQFSEEKAKHCHHLIHQRCLYSNFWEKNPSLRYDSNSTTVCFL